MLSIAARSFFETSLRVGLLTVGAGCEHTLFLSHAVLLQGGLEQFTAKLTEPLGKPLPPWPPTSLTDPKLGASAGPVGAVAAKLLR